jgi:hypothetical protein
MTKLISKLQYKNFEPGEFAEAQERSYEETIDLIEKFPWNSQREKIVIDLTNPSVTIEGKNNDFLKFALFFNQKFVLHYFDDTQTLFTKSFDDKRDGYQYIKNYFEQPAFDTADFKKENTWMQHNLKHFVTQDFRYTVTPKSARDFLLSTSGINFFISVVFLFLIFSTQIQIIGIFILLLLMFLIGGGLNLILFFNYYNYAKDKILIMSRGNDNFYFGSINNLVQYDKKDISQYTVFRMGGRSLFNGFAVVEIMFKNGTVVRIPNLLIDYLAMEQKLFEYPGSEQHHFSFV